MRLTLCKTVYCHYWAVQKIPGVGCGSTPYSLRYVAKKMDMGGLKLARNGKKIKNKNALIDIANPKETIEAEGLYAL